MSKKSFSRNIQKSHAKLMAWANARGIRFITKSEKEREQKRNEGERRFASRRR